MTAKSDLHYVLYYVSRASIPGKRLDLRFLQRQFAPEIGGSKVTMQFWETNRTEPEVRFIPKIITFLGYAPCMPGWTFGQRLKAMRTSLGLSQEWLAKRAGLDESTVAG